MLFKYDRQYEDMVCYSNDYSNSNSFCLQPISNFAPNAVTTNYLAIGLKQNWETSAILKRMRQARFDKMVSQTNRVLLIHFESIYSLRLASNLCSK